jgi:hypothetical protein
MILLLLVLAFPLVLIGYLLRTVIVQPKTALATAIFGVALYLLDHH